MSALITPTFKSIEQVMNLLAEEGMRDDIFVIIGGAVTNDMAKERMRTDAQTRDPMEGARMCREYVQGLAA